MAIKVEITTAVNEYAQHLCWISSGWATHIHSSAIAGQTEISRTGRDLHDLGQVWRQ